MFNDCYFQVIPSDCEPIELIDGEAHRIDDYRLTASSSLDGNSGPDRSRLYTNTQGALSGGWVAGYNDDNQWIQVC